MKNLFLTLALLIGFTANAGIIPPVIDGLPDSGDSWFTYTDSNNNLDDSNFETTFLFGDFNTFDYEVGLYSTNADNSVNQMLTIFDNTFSAGQQSNVVWNFGALTASTVFGSIAITGTASDYFGLYFRSDGQYYFSDAALNGGVDHFGLYWETDIFKDRNLLVYGQDAYDIPINKDKFLLEVNDVSPVLADIDIEVPEPSIALLLGLGLLSLATRKRAKI